MEWQQIPPQKNRRSPIRLVVLLVLAGAIGGLVGGTVVLATIEQTTRTVVVEREKMVEPLGAEPLIQSVSVDMSSAVTDSVEAVSPAVVTVVSHYSTRKSAHGEIIDQDGSGSGFIISFDGYIVTNNHVVDGAEQVEVVLFDGTILPVEVIGTEPYADLAILFADTRMPAVAEWGNSDLLKPGETVIAIGSPLGDFTNTVTVGVVSATERTLEITQDYFLEGLIQTDAAINQGNSGGPLINLDGKVVGINSLIVRGGNGGNRAVAEGLGFAIPSTFSREVADQLIKKGFFSRPFMGIRWVWITPELASRYEIPLDEGVLITDVVPGGPAEQAGINKGDILTSIMGQRIDASHPFRNLLFAHSPGAVIQLEIFRNDQIISTDLALGEMSPS